MLIKHNLIHSKVKRNTIILYIYLLKNLKFILVNLFKYMEYLSLQCAEHQMLVKVYL